MDSRNDVEKFMTACDQTGRDFGSQAELYMDLVIEEFKELVKAYGDRNRVEIADACADLKWVVEGLEITLGIPQQEVWDEVARSNLAKISDNGKVLKRADGKVLKPEGWTPPDIGNIIKRK
jgi:predicted HAD superfamily Cof-like phosphohydrolase